MNLLRRKYRILFLILIVGVIYLCFQFFSLKVLNFTSHRETIKNKQHIGGKVLDDPAFSYNEKFDSFKEGHDDTARVIGVNVDEGKVEIKIIDTDPEDRDVAEKDLDTPLGVHFTQTEQYRKRADGMFQCLYSKELMSYDAVNDDYCDCKDSTDEPGTSACPESKFYCTFQTADKPHWLPGSRVNDGVCDCCDGSDELAGAQVFSGIHLTGKRLKSSLSHTPCNNHCEEKQKANAEDVRIRKLGIQLKQSYINSGKSADKELYGPDGVFYKLSLTCFELETSEYRYKFCPFKSVTQQKSTDSPTNLGRDPVWKVKSGDNYVLEMKNGEAQRCPGGHPRKSVVTFICGLTDKIVSLAEEEKCVYKMKFSTPAAC